MGTVKQQGSGNELEKTSPGSKPGHDGAMFKKRDQYLDNRVLPRARKTMRHSGRKEGGWGTQKRPAKNHRSADLIARNKSDMIGRLIVIQKIVIEAGLPLSAFLVKPIIPFNFV